MESAVSAAGQSFPMKGITTAQVSKFIKTICGGEEELQGKTVEDVKLSYLLPFVNDHQRSYVDIISENEKESVFQANVYVIYSWKDPFLDVYHSLLHHLKKSSNAVIWWDFFSLNQYSLPGNSSCLLNMRRFHYFSFPLLQRLILNILEKQFVQ